MSFANKKLLQDILEKQTNQSREIKELGTLKTRFKESEETKKAKEWAFKEETQNEMKGYFTEFFLKNRSNKEVVV